MTRQYKKLPVTMKIWMQFNVMPRMISTTEEHERGDILDTNNDLMSLNRIPEEQMSTITIQTSNNNNSCPT